MLQIDSLGRLLLIFGIVVAVIGLVLTIGARIPGLNQLGNLSGDIRYTNASGTFGCFVPIVSSLLLSVILTIVLNVVIRLINK